MILKKKANTFNDYTLDISWGQLEAIKQALEASHAEVIADELREELAWYLERVPGPGEEEKDQKGREGAAAQGQDDFPIPMPPGRETATPGGAPQGGAGMGGGAMPNPKGTPLSKTEKGALKSTAKPGMGGDQGIDDASLPPLPTDEPQGGGAPGGDEPLPDVSEDPTGGGDETDQRLPKPPRR